jgi:hypothetical protein
MRKAPPPVPKKSKTSMVIDNMEDILSQRSQVSGSEIGGSLNDYTLTKRTSRVSALGHVTKRSRASRPALSSEDEVDDFGGQMGLMNPSRLVRRHSAVLTAHSTHSVRESESSSSSGSSPVSEPLARRRKTDFPTRRSAPITEDRITVNDVSDDEESLAAQQRNGGLLKCLACFKFGSSSVENPNSRGPSPSLTLPHDFMFNNPLCASVDKLLASLADKTEIDCLLASDQRTVFLLFAALSGEPLLSPSEYAECDEWIDWLSIGFSSSELDSFERDINRTGSQAMGFLFQTFFALEFTEAARIAALVIRNLHFDPSALFGLFAVNCAKWTRDMMRQSMREFELTSSAWEGPEFLVSAKSFASEGRKYIKFFKILDYWISKGLWGDISSVEDLFTDGTGSLGKQYESFQDEDFAPFSSEGEMSSPETTRPRGRKPVKKRPQIKTKTPAQNRVTGIDVNLEEDRVLVRQTLAVGGLCYTFCVLSFVKFWLKKDLLSVDAEVARERLTNAYLEAEFVAQLKLDPKTSVGTLIKNIERLRARVDQLWKSSGWTRKDLVGSSEITQLSN